MLGTSLWAEHPYRRRGVWAHAPGHCAMPHPEPATYTQAILVCAPGVTGRSPSLELGAGAGPSAPFPALTMTFTRPRGNPSAQCPAAAAGSLHQTGGTCGRCRLRTLGMLPQDPPQLQPRQCSAAPALDSALNPFAAVGDHWPMRVPRSSPLTGRRGEVQASSGPPLDHLVPSPMTRRLLWLRLPARHTPV